MKRFSLSSKRRKLVAAGGLLAASIVLASAFLVGSGADFTSTSANPSNVFTAGKIVNSNSKDGAAILTMDKMKPGDVQTGTVTIQNTGDISGAFTLSMQKTADTTGTNPVRSGHLFNVLTLKIEDGSTVVYNGNLKDFTSLAAVTYAASASHTYTFTVTFPKGDIPADNASGDNAYMGSSSTVEFDWAAIQ